MKTYFPLDLIDGIFGIYQNKVVFILQYFFIIFEYTKGKHIKLYAGAEVGSICSQEWKFSWLETSFYHANNMTSSGLRKMLYLTIFKILGVSCTFYRYVCGTW